MRRPATPVLVVIGLVVGVLAAFGGTVLSTEGPPVDTLGPQSTVVDADFRFAANETTLEPSVLVPVSLVVEDGEVVFSYDLIDISTRPVGTFTRPEDAELPVAAPENWTLRTTVGDIEGRTSTTRARTARFTIEGGFDLDNIRSIRLDSWRTRLPLLHRIEIGHDDVTEHVLDEETSVTLRRVLIQSNNSLVQLRISGPSALFSAAAGSFSAAFEAHPQVRGVGPGWTNVGPVEGGVQLTFVGDQLPDPIPLTVRTHGWVVVNGPLDIDTSGLFDG